MRRPELIPAPRESGLPSADRPLRFGYVGTVTETMPIEELAEAWRIARRDPRIGGRPRCLSTATSASSRTRSRR